MTASFSHIIIILELRDIGWDVSVLSAAANSSLLLAANVGDSSIYIHDPVSHRSVTFFSIPNNNDGVRDAVWTHSGRVVFSTTVQERLVTWYNGSVISEHYMTDISSRSVFNESSVYLADEKHGVYQSVDDGMTWVRVPLGNGTLKPLQVIITVSGDLWILNTSDAGCRVHVYNQSADGINMSSETNLLVNHKSRMAYDSKVNAMFLTDHDNSAVYVFMLSTSQPLVARQLAANFMDDNTFWSIAVDSERGLLYVGQSRGTIGIYKLMYY